MRAYISYQRIHQTLTYWSTKHGHEVDFIIEDEIAIEVKSTNKITEKHLKSLKLLQEENICKKYFLASQDKIERNINGIECIHWKISFEKLWENNLA